MDELKEKNYLLNIKSPYNRKDIFLYLNTKIILNVIIYNKQLQESFGVSKIDYLKVSGKYKLGEKNGKGREYDLYTNELIFKGEYLDGKRNGKGIEYNISGDLRFEGEYVNGKRNGKGKEYYYRNFGVLNPPCNTYFL